jgi:hypothetical protein
LTTAHSLPHSISLIVCTLFSDFKRSLLPIAHLLAQQPACIADLHFDSSPTNFNSLSRITKMLSNSVFVVLAAMSLAAATPVDYTLQARGNTPSKPADIHCSGEIIGYRTVTTKVRQALLVDIP